MGRAAHSNAEAPLIIAITGPRSALGRGLRRRLERHPRIAGLVCLDVASEPDERPRTTWRRVDLTDPAASSHVIQALAETKANALAHLAFLSGAVRDPAYAHELEAIGTLQVFAACEAAGIARVVMASSTTVYGASPSNPSLLLEDRPLLGNPRSRWVGDRVEAEAQARRFAETHPQARVATLRLAPLLGAALDSPTTRLLRQRLVPMLWGYDPLFQALHPDDATMAIEAALLDGARGAFNIAGDGVLPLSSIIRLSGSVPLPLPHPLARTVVRALAALGITNVPPSLLDYFRYPWVGDVRRAREVLGFRPRYSTRAVVMDFSRGKAVGSESPGRPVSDTVRTEV